MLVLALTGCAWLFEVPEANHPTLEDDREANRVANQVNRDGAYIDPENRAKASTELSTQSELPPERRDLRDQRRKTPTMTNLEDRKPFEFKTASGDTIVTSGGAGRLLSGDGYPTAEDMGISEAERQEMIRNGELEPEE